MNRTRRREKREEKLLNFKSLVALLGSCLAIGTSGQRLPPIHTTPTPKLRRCSSCLRWNVLTKSSKMDRRLWVRRSTGTYSILSPVSYRCTEGSRRKIQLCTRIQITLGTLVLRTYKLPAFSVLRSLPSLGQIFVLINSCTNKLQIAIAKFPSLSALPQPLTPTSA